MWTHTQTYRLRDVDPRHRPAMAIIRRNGDSVKPRKTMRDFILGVALLAIWIVLQFVVQSTSGFIHIALAAGVVLVIRGIALSKWGTPTP